VPRATSRMPPRVMLVGDSYAALLSASQLESLCLGSSVTNRGRSGSTVEEWAQGQLSASDWDGYTHAWLSVGANDYINSFGTVVRPVVDPRCTPPHHLRGPRVCSVLDLSGRARWWNGRGVPSLASHRTCMFC
jgi:hypothetical protein